MIYEPGNRGDPAAAGALQGDPALVAPEFFLDFSFFENTLYIWSSPTLSDQAALSCPSLKLGPGDSRRSHSADEFIYVREIEEGISLYIQMLERFLAPA